MRSRLRSVRVTRLLGVVIGTLFVVAGAIIIALVSHSMHQQALVEAEAKMRLMLNRNLAVHTYFSQILKPNLFEWTEPFRSDDYFDASWMSSSFAVREIDNYFESLSEEPYYFKDAAVNARSPENEADTEERAFIAQLKTDPSLQERSSVRTIDGEPYLVVLQAGEVLEESCLRCHGDPADAPSDLVARYGPQRSFHREAELGNVISAVSVRVPLSAAYAEVDAVSVQLSALLVFVLGSVFAVLFWLPRRLVFAPLGVLREKSLQISEHDEQLGQQIAVPFGEELGTLTSAFNTMSAKLQESHDHLETRVRERTAELERSEKALRHSERMLKSAEATAHVGYYEIDLPTGITIWSEETFRIFGLDSSGSEPTVDGYQELVHPDDATALYARFERSVAEQTPFDLTYRVYHSSGEIRHVHSIGQIEADSTGAGAKLFGTLQDITERMRIEVALRDSEERLRQNQRLEAVGSLAGGIAHDFNNLLTAIIGRVEMLRGASQTPEEHNAGLQEIRSVADRAATLTRQLLAFSRLQTLQVRVLNVNDVNESMRGLLERVLGEDIDLVFRADPALWPVEADPGQLEQVLMNLAVNARDAMPQGGRLTIETANTVTNEDHAATRLGTRAGPNVLLSVSDTGHGMDAETLARIFEPFFTTKEQGKGTGLGLSTAYGIIKQSGGNILVHSEPGRGSMFQIYLPRTEKLIDWSPKADTVPAGAADTGSETVLVVEDEPSVRVLTTRILVGKGYRVISAGSPDEAIDLFDSHPDGIDLVLSDVVLPGMSGRAMVDLLLKKPGPSPRVLYMSGYARDVLVQEGRLERGIALLEKPFAPDDLLRRIREVLDAAVER